MKKLSDVLGEFETKYFAENSELEPETYVEIKDFIRAAIASAFKATRVKKKKEGTDDMGMVNMGYNEALAEKTKREEEFLNN